MAAMKPFVPTFTPSMGTPSVSTWRATCSIVPSPPKVMMRSAPAAALPSGCMGESAGTSTKAGLMTVECPSDSSIVLAASVRARPLSRYGLGARTIFFIPYPAPRETRRL